MIAYASRTGTRRNLDALRAAGWRLMVSATGVLRTEGFPYALDNGAWTAYQRGEPFDRAKFTTALDRFGAGADFVVVPDVVGQADATLRSIEEWMPVVAGATKLPLLAVQDGMEPSHLAGLVGPACGIFVGGTTRWKEQSLPIWAAVAAQSGCLLHVGRVNTVRRIVLCQLAGADSFDGTSVSRYVTTLAELEPSLRQMTWPLLRPR